MFIWTLSRLFAAIDAGVPEVIRLYNETYATVVGLLGYTPSPLAHAKTRALVIAYLNQQERQIAISMDALDAALPTPVYSASA